MTTLDQYTISNTFGAIGRTGDTLSNAVSGLDFYNGCPCPTVLRESQNLIASLCTSHANAIKDMEDVLSQAKALVWEGKAGEAFHADVNGAIVIAQTAGNGATTTARFIESPEALL